MMDGLDEGRRCLVGGAWPDPDAHWPRCQAGNVRPDILTFEWQIKCPKKIFLEAMPAKLITRIFLRSITSTGTNCD